MAHWVARRPEYIMNVKSTISLQNTVAAVGFCLYVVLNKYSYRKLVFKKYKMFCVPTFPRYLHRSN